MKIKTEKSDFSPSLNSLVWARMRFCPFWPARVVKTPPALGRTPSKKTCVLFFGDKQFGFVDHDKIIDYANNREKLVSKGRGLAFHNAVKQMDEYISNPVEFRSHASVKPINKKIPIKTERDIELLLNIKTEKRVSSGQSQSDAVSSPKIGSNEKQSLIEKIVALKSENNQNILALKSSQLECETLLIAKQNLEQKLNETEAAFEIERKKLQTELVEAKNHCAASKFESDKIIADLKSELVETNTKFAAMETNFIKTTTDFKNEIKMLQSRIKQYQRGLDQRESKMELSIEREFEVEAIINHRETASGKEYLIRWKGYDEDEDSWEKESNLNCQKILKAYIRSSGMKNK